MVRAIVVVTPSGTHQNRNYAELRRVVRIKIVVTPSFTKWYASKRKVYKLCLCAAVLRSAKFHVHGNEETLNQGAQAW